VPTFGRANVCVDSNCKFINLCQYAYWHCVSHVHCYLHLIVLPPVMAPIYDIWVFTAVLLRIQVTGMRRCRSATPHSATSQNDWNLKLFVVRQAAIYCLSEGTIGLLFDSKKFYTYICKMSSAKLKPASPASRIACSDISAAVDNYARQYDLSN